MKRVIWLGPDPLDRTSCPYSIDCKCKPAPAGRLNSLESGRLILTINLKGKAVLKVEEVEARVINKAKEKSLQRKRPTSRLKRKVQVTAALAQDITRRNRWTGAFDIPITWVEGGTQAYERAGSWTPRRKGKLFTLEVTYRLGNGVRCGTRFGAEDVFHWSDARVPRS